MKHNTKKAIDGKHVDLIVTCDEDGEIEGITNSWGKEIGIPEDVFWEIKKEIE